MKVSADLRLLWSGYELLDAAKEAKKAGFEAVSVGWPYVTHALDISILLSKLDLQLVSLDTSAGNLARGEFGVAALPGRQGEARNLIDKAFAYAVDVSARHINVLMGVTSEGASAMSAAISNLSYAAKRGEELGVGVLLEPLSSRRCPGYFVSSLDVAARMIEKVGSDDLKLVFDQSLGLAEFGERHVAARLGELADTVGVFQVSSDIDREPRADDTGLIELFEMLSSQGFSGFVSGSYRPENGHAGTLEWPKKATRSADKPL